MKKVLFVLLIVSLKMFGQTPKMEVVVSAAENVDGIKVTSKNTTPSSHNYSIYGLNKSTTFNGVGVFGGHEGNGTGVSGWSKNGHGVYGFSQFSTGGSGVYGLVYGAGRSGVRGYSENGDGNGILGEAESGIGVKGHALNFFGNAGIGGHFSNALSTGYALVTGTGKLKFEGPGVGTLGVNKFLKSINANGDAEWSDLLPLTVSQNTTQPMLSITNTNTGNYNTVEFKTNTTGSNSAIEGMATNTSANSNSRGVTGINFSSNSLGSGVYGFHAGSGSGVWGYSALGKGIKGSTLSGTGVYGEATSTGTGVYGSSVNGKGVEGSTTNNGNAIYGFASNGGFGVYGATDSGIGVYGYSNYLGVSGSSDVGTGGFFSSESGYALTTGTGKVGIGTTAPSAKMDIKGSTKFSHFYFGANEDTYIRGGKTGSKVLINDEAGMGSVGIGLDNPNELLDVNGRMRIRHNVNTSGLWMSNSTNSLNGADGAFYGMKTDTETGIFIGGTWRFWVTNVGNATLLGTLTQSSDKRLKKDFLSLNNSLSNIYKLNGYHFKWIEASRSNDLQTGLIAQEVQKIFPELVQTDEKGILSVNYIGLIPHLIEAVKELRDENNSLKTNNKTLTSRLDKIEAMLNQSPPNSENQSFKR